MSDEKLIRELEETRQELDQLKNRAPSGIRLKVSEKGGLSVYGLGRFPVTLYKEQWIKLLALAVDIRDFILEHDSQLKAQIRPTRPSIAPPQRRQRPRRSERPNKREEHQKTESAEDKKTEDHSD